MKKYNTVLFDLDGTLTDPKEGITKSVQYALEKLGIIEGDTAKLESFIGPPLHVSFMQRYMFDEQLAQKAVCHYREYFSEKGIYENEVYSGIPEMLKQLGTNQMDCICATSKPVVYAERILQHFAINTYFTFIVGSSLDFKNTGKTDIVASVLKKIGTHDTSNVVMVGDRAVDIIGARNNGIDSIAVTYGYGSMSELENASPTYVVHTVDELTSILLPSTVNTGLTD